MRVQNRLVWADGFTNDKRAHSNKEAYTKQCKRCSKKIWMKPEKSGWKALNANGEPHICSKPKVKGYEKPCRNCGEKIRMKKTKKSWKPMNLDGKPHKC